MTVETPLIDVIGAARELAHAGRLERALSLLDNTVTGDARARSALALAAAEVTRESGYHTDDTGEAAVRLDAARSAYAEVTPDAGMRWDLDFLTLRQTYLGLVYATGRLRLGPAGHDPTSLATLREAAEDLHAVAPDERRRGWASFYRGLVEDNLYGNRDAAPPHYAAALAAGAEDDLLAREALRHLGDHAHDDGDHEQARAHWERATTLGARAGLVQGTLAQHLLLAVLRRDEGDEAGATALATEIARWAAAIGTTRIHRQATEFLAGVDPTAAPPTTDQ